MFTTWMPKLLKCGIQSTHIHLQEIYSIGFFVVLWVFFPFFLHFNMLLASSCNITEKSIVKVMGNE